MGLAYFFIQFTKVESYDGCNAFLQVLTDKGYTANMEEYPYPQGRSDYLPYTSPLPNYVLFVQNEEIFLYENVEHLYKTTSEQFREKVYLKDTLIIYYNGQNEKLKNVISTY